MARESRFGMVLGLMMVILVAVIYHAPGGGRPASTDAGPPGGAGNTSPRISIVS